MKDRLGAGLVADQGDQLGPGAVAQVSVEKLLARDLSAHQAGARTAGIFWRLAQDFLVAVIIIEQGDFAEGGIHGCIIRETGIKKPEITPPSPASGSG